MPDEVRSAQRRRLLSSAAFALLLAVAAFVWRKELAAWFGGTPGASAPEAPSAGSTSASAKSEALAGDIDHYTCSMHPSVNQKGPGKCPICGMELIPVTREQHEQGVVVIDDARRQLIGVRTGKVSVGSMRRSFRAVGQIAYDESKLTDVNLKVQGFITKLFVSKTGQRVSAGQPLFTVYSPELYNAQQDFLLASKGASAMSGAGGSFGQGALGRAARQRLHLLGLPNGVIDAIEKSGAPMENVVMASPASGFVIEKDVVEGSSVEPGMRLFRIAALNRVWVEVEVYEADLAHVTTGQTATVSLDYLPGRSYEAKVAYVYPYLDPKNRTGRVRVELANEGGELRPGMYASVELAADPTPRLQVPASAVVYTGPRRLVFLDLGEGRFKPSEIRVGVEADGMYEVLEGLKEGDAVATSGVFLIAAEARIRTAAKYWEHAEDGAHTHAPDVPPPASVSPAPKAPLQAGGAVAPASRERSEHAEGGGGSGRASEPRGVKTPREQKPPPARAVPSAAPSSSSEETPVYSCPMHPEVRSPVPGKCPKCGMDLVRAPGAAR
jgi:Cu(I)/Ag(I) efflux system membrane fusion protein